MTHWAAENEKVNAKLVFFSLFSLFSSLYSLRIPAIQMALLALKMGLSAQLNFSVNDLIDAS